MFFFYNPFPRPPCQSILQSIGLLQTQWGMCFSEDTNVAEGLSSQSHIPSGGNTYREPWRMPNLQEPAQLRWQGKPQCHCSTLTTAELVQNDWINTRNHSLMQNKIIRKQPDASVRSNQCSTQQCKCIAKTLCLKIIGDSFIIMHISV